MAAADYKGLVESIYISYFGRPADTLGLANFAAQLDAMKAPTTVVGLNAAYKSTPALRTLVDSFGASAESTNLYGSDNVAFVSAIYQNLLNRSADFDGLVYWVTEISAGRLTKGNAALAIMAGAFENKSAQGLLDAQVLNNKVSIATNFTAAVDTADELNAYRGDAAAATARDMLKTVTATTSPTAFQATVDATLAAIVTNSIPVVNTTLTTGVDAFTGTSGNDNFKALVGAGATLTAFDSIDGGAGNNSLSIIDLGTGATVTSLPAANASITYKNIQTLNVQTATTAGANIDGTLISSLTALNIITSTGADVVKASGTTAVKVFDTAGSVAVTGGSTVDITTDTAVGSTVTVTGVAGKTSSVAVKGGNGITIADPSAGTATASSIATVSLDSAAGATTITSDALTALNLTKSNGGVTVNAAAGTRALNVALNGQTGGTITDATATTVNVATLTAKSTASLSAAAATSVNLAAGVDTTISSLTADLATAVTITGSGKVSVGAASLAALTSVNASGNTGGVSITPVLGNGVVFTGGTGVDSISIGATTKAITMGDGNDSVTLTAVALGTGGSVDGGAGVDTLVGTSALMSAQLAATATAAKITGFETIKVSDMLAAGASFDVSALVGAMNFTAAAGVVTGGTATVAGLGAGANVAILGSAANNGTLSLAMKADTAADVLNVTVNHDFANTGAATSPVTSLSAALVETLNVTTNGTALVAAGTTPDSVTNVLSISDAALVTLNLSGSQAVSFASAAALTKLAMIDASANTAGATIDASASVAGLTIKGSATAANTLVGGDFVDTIVGGAKSDIIVGGKGGDTLTGNGGNDTFVIGNGHSTITLGNADTITDFVANTYGAGTSGAVNSLGATGVAAAKLTGDVIQLTHNFSVAPGAAAGITVGVYTNASDATTFLATASASESATAQTIHAALNSSTGDLYVDINADGVADLYIHLTGVTTLTAAAFLIV